MFWSGVSELILKAVALSEGDEEAYQIEDNNDGDLFFISPRFLIEDAYGKG